MTTMNRANSSQTTVTIQRESVVKTLASLAVMVLGLGLATGCANVAPYERGKLAHPTMTAADTTGFGEAHLRAISEGATGGSAGTGSGCGCN